MTEQTKWMLYVSAAITGVVIYGLLSAYTTLDAPWPFAIAALVVAADIIALRWLAFRGR